MNKDMFHILVVDDDNRIRDLVKQYLEENDYDLEASINARRQWMSSAKDTIDIPKNTDPFKLTNIAEAIDSSPIIDTKAAKRVNVNVRHRLEKLDDDIFEL